MPHYRLYRLDGVGKISAAEWIEADDDDHAGRQARDRAGTSCCELWDRHRLVARIGSPS